MTKVRLAYVHGVPNGSRGFLPYDTLRNPPIEEISRRDTLYSLGEWAELLVYGVAAFLALMVCGIIGESYIRKL
jgi:hypothetical protein